MTRQSQTKPSWRQLEIDVAEGASLILQEALLDEGALGIEVIDDETQAIPEKPFVPTHRALIRATFEHSSDLETRIIERIQDEWPLEADKDFQFAWHGLPDGDWANEFLRSWKSFNLGDDIWIVPSWEREHFKPPHENAIVLYLDPGMAFGTGHHETTTLCARALRHRIEMSEDPISLRVLDVGTGTGILAMIAAKMGVKYVVGTDNDPQACLVAEENIRNNSVNEIEIVDAFPDFRGPVFNIVVANILARPLIEMVSFIKGSMAKGATLLLSGVLIEQESSVRDAYVASGLVHRQTEKLNEWVLIELYNP